MFRFKTKKINKQNKNKHLKEFEDDVMKYTVLILLKKVFT